MLNIGVRGAALGLVYACLHLYQKKQVLSFPIIQVLPPTSLISGIKLQSVPKPYVIHYLQGPSMLNIAHQLMPSQFLNWFT